MFIKIRLLFLLLLPLTSPFHVTPTLIPRYTRAHALLYLSKPAVKRTCKIGDFVTFKGDYGGDSVVLGEGK